MSDFPNISRPLARGAGTCHVLAVREYVATLIAACGANCGTPCGDASLEQGVTHCFVHREPICLDCIEIVEEFERTGIWKGVEGDPETFGVRHTVCLDVDCPELIPIRSCWCWEHLRECDGHDCDHGAHLCEAAVHYCDRHALGRE